MYKKIIQRKNNDPTIDHIIRLPSLVIICFGREFIWQLITILRFIICSVECSLSPTCTVGGCLIISAPLSSVPTRMPQIHTDFTFKNKILKYVSCSQQTRKLDNGLCNVCST